MNLLEKICAAILILVPSIGHIVARVDPHFFDHVYVGEDEFFETMTAVFLLLCSLICIYRIFILRKARPLLFSLCLALAAFACFFGAGEEVSWGQRVFKLKTPEILQKYNHQGELNLHNIKIGDFKVNKVIFSQLMTLGLVFYFLVLPLLYRRKEFFKTWSDRMAIPIPYHWHMWTFLLSTLIASLIPEQRRWELLEFGGTFLFFLIFLNPVNKEIFKTHNRKSA